MLKATYRIPDLPPPVDFETVRVLKALAMANRALAELKARAATIPNQGILIDTLALQEAKASSEVENIVTTQDELFQVDLFPDGPKSAAAKEVALYRGALRLGYERLRTTGGSITNNTIIDMFRLLKRRQDGFRTTPGTALKHDRTGETVYVPPQDANELTSDMSALERFINDDEASPLDPLIKMPLIHHQFESIHPFPDGNGRIGRILNVLYLTRTGLLEIPVPYLSRHITQSKGNYYRLLQAVRDSNGAADAWEDWVLNMLEGIATTSATTLAFVEGIREQMAQVKHKMRSELPNLYSQDMLNNLFRHPYTRIDYVMADINFSRQTAAKYLDMIADRRFITKHQAGRNNYYERREGESKLDTLVTLDFLGLLVSKLFGDLVSVRFLMFSLVGAIGVLVHLFALRGSMLGLGLDFNAAQALATFVAMTTNFVLNNQLTYRDCRLSGLAMLRGLLTFYAVCSVGVLANVGVANMIYENEPVWWLAGTAGAAMGAVWNYAASSVFTWRKA